MVVADGQCLAGGVDAPLVEEVQRGDREAAAAEIGVDGASMLTTAFWSLPLLAISALVPSWVMVSLFSSVSVPA